MKIKLFILIGLIVFKLDCIAQIITNTEDIQNRTIQTDSSAIKYNNRIKKKTDDEIKEEQDLQQVPDKYIKKENSKIEQYNSRITKKTEKTLERLSKYETKIKSILQKTSPETEQRLFGNGQMTFTSLLQKLKNGESITTKYQAQYDTYNDKLTTRLKYLQQQKDKLDSGMVKPIADANKNMTELNKEEDQSAAIQQFIKERRKQLMSGAMQYLRNSKYLTSINKEAFYYTETLKNYKQLFSDPDKLEQAATATIARIPFFQKFMGQNSQLSSLFKQPSGSLSDNSDSSAKNTDSAQNILGLQTRASVENTLQQKVPTSGPNMQQVVTQNEQQAQSEVDALKSKLNQLIGGNNNNDINMPQGFKPNMQKTKTFLQRIEYGFNIQFLKSNNYLPASSNIAGSIGYKLNDKSTIGIGISYIMGLGGGSFNQISLSSQGVGLRSYIDEKIKGSISITGGYEQNYQGTFTELSIFRNISAWQRSGLIGLTKKYKVGKQNSTMQVLWDFLSYQQVPRTAAIKFRVGYTF